MTAAKRRTLVWVLCLAIGLAGGFAVGLLIADPVPDCTGLCVTFRWASVPGGDPVLNVPDPVVPRRRAEIAFCTITGLVAGLAVANVLHARAKQRNRPPTTPP